jgi:hypothetical protein
MPGGFDRPELPEFNASLNGSVRSQGRVETRVILTEETKMFRRGGLKGVMSLRRCPPPPEAL